MSSDPTPASDQPATNAGAAEQPRPAHDQPGQMPPGTLLPRPVLLPGQQGFRPEKKLPMHPRRVRGGIKLKRKEGEPVVGWITERMTRLVEAAASGDAVRDGLEYAQLGQTRRLELSHELHAGVQGRSDRAYKVTIVLEPFSDEQRDQIIAALLDQPRFAAKLLAGEVPPNIEDLFSPLGLKLLPTEPGDLAVTCTCKEKSKPWCKHVVCTALLLGEHLGTTPLDLFGLRGLPPGELTERLRELRALSGQGPGPIPVYSPHVMGVSDRPTDSLEVSSFWDPAVGLDEVDLSANAPEVSHVLLRRLGPSPFTDAKFPLVGLLATCYELISEHAQADSTAEDDPDIDAD